MPVAPPVAGCTGLHLYTLNSLGRRHQQVVLLRLDRQRNRTPVQGEPGHRQRRRRRSQRLQPEWLCEDVFRCRRTIQLPEMCAIQSEPDRMSLDPHPVLSVVDDTEIRQHVRPTARPGHGFTQQPIRPATLPGEVGRIQIEAGSMPLDRPNHACGLVLQPERAGNRTPGLAVHHRLSQLSIVPGSLVPCRGHGSNVKRGTDRIGAPLRVGLGRFELPLSGPPDRRVNQTTLQPDARLTEPSGVHLTSSEGVL
jgi:hypothetical protein